MNKKHIKRLLVLDDLGIDVKDELSEFIDHNNFFKEVMGEIGILRKVYNKVDISWFKGSDEVLSYSIEYNHFLIKHRLFIIPYIDKYDNTSYSKICSILEILLELYFNVPVDSVTSKSYL